MNLRFTYIRVCSVAGLALSLLAFPVRGYGDSGNHNGREWIARVAERTLYLDEMVRRYTDFLASNGMQDNLAVRKAILDNMINEELLLHADPVKTVLARPEYRNDVERARTRVTLAYLKDRDIYATITATDEEVRQAFLRSNEKLTARHLYARTEEEANELYQLLLMGVDFAVLASQVFTDSTLRNNGGYLGEFTWGDMDPEFEEAAYSLVVGETSAPVKTAHGYSIIRLESQVAHPLLTEYQFLQKKSHLTRVLRIRKKKPAEVEYLRRVMDQDRVVYNDNVLTEMLQEMQPGWMRDGEWRGAGSPEDECARFDGTVYTRADLRKILGQLPGYQRNRIVSLDGLKAALKGFLIQHRLLEIASAKGYDTVAVVRETFEKTRDVIYLKYRIREITENAPVSDSLAHDFYLTNLHLFSTDDELNVQEIIVADKALADKLKTAIAAGEDFGSLARRHSLRQWSAENNGIMGYAPVARYAHLGGMLWESPVGELVGPVAIEGYHGLFRVLGRKAGIPIPFDRVADRVKAAVRLEYQRTIVKEHVDLLRERAGVSVNTPVLLTFRLDEVL